MRRRARATMAGAAAGAAPEAAAAAARAALAAAGRRPHAPAPALLLWLLLLCAARASTGAALPGPGPGPPPTPSTASATALASTPAQPQGLLCDWPLCNCTFAGQTRVIARCRLPKNQDVEIAPGALPPWLLELHVEGGAAVRVQAGAFSAVRDVRLVNVSGAGSVVVRRHAFLNVSSQHVFLHAADCAAVVLESHAFRAPAGPASLEVRRCGHVVVQSAAFAWLLRAHLHGVVRLELASNAFALEQPDGRRHGPAPSVVLERVMVAELPPLAFPSQVAEVRLVEAQVRAVRRDAFYALQLSAVAVVNSSLQQVDAGAFSARTLVLQLSVQGSRVGRLASGALRGAVGNLSIVDSQVETVEEGAVDITVAKVALERCSVGAVRERGFAFAKWNSVVVRGNAFRELHAHALWAPFQRMSGVHAYEVRWQDNNVTDLRPGALAAVADAARRAGGDARGQLVVEVSGLRLEAACRCDLRERLLGGEAPLAAAASCRVDAALARCLGVLREGRAPALDYEARVCDQSERVLVCEAAPTARGAGGGGGLDELPPPSAAADTPDRGRKVLALVFAAVVLGSLLVLAASGALWLHRKGYCRGAGRWAPPASAASCLAQVARLWAARGARHRAPAATATAAAAAAAAGGSPRAHAHHAAAATHYTELRRGDPAGADADDPDEEAGGAGGAEAEDKWTQTLPEELTQELLQALREKLDDPDNYSEARDMIEHLYDLIKVEESCSNNNRAGGAGGAGAGLASGAGSLADLVDTDDDNLYEAIRPRVRRARTGDTCSVGTRAPSPDALEPPATPAATRAATRAPLLCEYVEPRDRAQHLYAELPGGVAGPGAGGGPASPPRVSRPLSFLRSLGETLQAVLPARGGGPPPASPPPPPPSAACSPPASPPPAPARLAHDAAAAAAAAPTTSLLCEYAEPTDAEVHVYSELPPAMVNRPLPDTPAGANPRV
ncbi:hypothetical protein R5R35_013989 [Gryllus longicercus]|uniref:Uncharacterized protein n=1 Tax=Gryllus longicercus TaxID=2509291 RepID=A0AAN9W0K8_9ORTH